MTLPDTLEAESAELMARAEKAEQACTAMREALRGHCTGTTRTSCTYCGDSTFDHECNDREVECSLGCGAALADNAGQDYVHRDALMKVAERVLGAANSAVETGADYCECWAGLSRIDLAAIVKEVAP